MLPSWSSKIYINLPFVFAFSSFGIDLLTILLLNPYIVCIHDVVHYARAAMMAFYVIFFGWIDKSLVYL